MTARISQLKTETVDAGKAQKNHFGLLPASSDAVFEGGRSAFGAKSPARAGYKGAGEGQGPGVEGGARAPAVCKILEHVLEETFGWLKCNVPVDHPSAKQRAGKIYASKKAGQITSTGWNGAVACFSRKCELVNGWRVSELVRM